MILFEGELGSLSQYWDTHFQPLFILSNAITSYFFFTLKNWRIPSFFLLLLTAFSWDQFFILHDIFAVGFFLSSLYSLWNSKRFLGYFILFGLSILVIPFNMLWGEIFAIIILSLFHLTILIYAEKLKKRWLPCEENLSSQDPFRIFMYKKVWK